MNQLSLLDAPAELGRVLRDHGIESARIGAELDDEGWGDRAFALLVAHMRRIGVGAMFQIVDVRLQAEEFEDAPEPRAWGAVAQRAMKAGMIRRVGYAQCNDPRQHAAITTVWRVDKV